MSKHRPTPWTYETTEDRNAFAAEIGADEVSDWRDFRQNGECIGSSYMKDEAENEANSARLVACVNAFHSGDGREIPTENIEPGMVWEMRDRIYLAQELLQ